jgi:hypothetical protein
MTDSDTETDAPTRQNSDGFLSDDVKAYLTEEGEPDAIEDVRSELQSSLYGALRDFRLLWHYMSDADVERAFANPDDDAQRAIGGGTDAIVALLYLGGLISGDDMPYRIRAGIARAEAARGNRAEVALDVRTSEMLSPRETVEKLEAGKAEEVTYYESERLWLDDEISVDRLAMRETQFDAGLTLEEVAEAIQQERDAFAPMVRYLTPPLVDRDDSEGDNSGMGSWDV